MVLVKKTLPAKREPDISANSLEAVGVVIGVGAEKWIIRSVYVPKYMPGLADDLRKVLSGERVICMGDWNARHSEWDATPNRIGRILANVLPFNGMNIFHGGRTTYQNSQNTAQSMLDFVICNVPIAPTMATVQSLKSDHTAIGAIFRARTNPVRPSILAYC